MTHAPLLLAESLEEFESLKEQRELPTCPPQRDDDSGYCGWREDTGFKLHHAAVFAEVNWTNFFFPSDPIGGPLKDIFGDGIHDIELPDAPENTWFDHVCYWKVGSRLGSKKFKMYIRQLLERGQPLT